MNKIFFLLFFSLFAISGSEKYTCTFEKISHDPSDIQRNALNLDQSSCDEETRLFVRRASKELRLYTQYFIKDSYCCDANSKTAVCLQGNESNSFEIPFYDNVKMNVVIHHKNIIDQKPLCVAVRDRFIFHLSAQAEFCFIKVPQVYNQICSQPLITKTFNNVHELLNFNEKIYCFPGDSGKFYLTHDSEGRKNLFLFKIEEESRRSRLNFWSLPLFGLGFFFLATIFLYRKYYSN